MALPLPLCCAAQIPGLPFGARPGAHLPRPSRVATAHLSSSGGSVLWKNTQGEAGMELTQHDSGGRRTTRVGEELSVALAENPTTGYRWHPEIDAGTLQQTDDRYEGPTEPRGAAGTRRLTFRVLRPGQVHLRVVKRRSCEKTAVDEFSIDLD